jgi:uncharacterized repeat protein (TIGR03987 family)
MMVAAIVFINLAALFYTIGVWAEKFQGRLKWWHTAVFWLGFICDTTGTTAMSLLAGSLIQFNFHGITGLSAVLLMLFHSIWATKVLIQNNEKMLIKFHKFSFVVWIIWLIPMITGVIFGTTVSH